MKKNIWKTSFLIFATSSVFAVASNAVDTIAYRGDSLVLHSRCNGEFGRVWARGRITGESDWHGIELYKYDSANPMMPSKLPLPTDHAGSYKVFAYCSGVLTFITIGDVIGLRGVSSVGDISALTYIVKEREGDQ